MLWPTLHLKQGHCSHLTCADCRETVRKTTRLHQWDVLRANKAPFAFGLEPRVPFLDKAFVAASMEVDPSEKMVSRVSISLSCNLPPQQCHAYKALQPEHA